MYLKQSTASQSRMVGPFVDDTDFKTAKTALTIANTDVKLSVNGAAGANKNSGGGTHRNNGMYSLTFDATDTATVGELAGSIVIASALPVAFKFFVLEEAIYDALFAASAAAFDANQDVTVGGYAAGQAPLQPTVAARTLDVTATGEAGIDWANIGGPTTVQGLSGTTIKNVTDVLADTDDIQTRLPAALTANGNIKADTLRVGGTVQTAGDIPAMITVVDDFVDTEVAAIKAKTDNLPATPAATGDAMTLTGGERNSVADALLDRAAGIETSFTLRQAMRLVLAAAAGKLSGAATATVKIRDVNDTKDRVTATVDASGNRSAVTTDVT